MPSAVPGWSASTARLLLDLALTPKRLAWFGTTRPVERGAVRDAMNRVAAWNQRLTGRALDGLSAIPGITIYGPRDPARRTSLVAFNLAGRDPVAVARALDQAGIESRAGCHCATLAHHALGLTPPASCRLSFYLYNTPGEVDQAVAEVAKIAAGHTAPRSRSRVPRRSWCRPEGPDRASPPAAPLPSLRALPGQPGRLLGQRQPERRPRRPWCLSCCDDLDRAACHVTPFTP